ncbi:MAG TPA: response regulator [Gaiellaceae bacterium]|jgi:DNA-binding response OmpR family regulator|nr:response regulator [Gaiellaceae bacterium]
MTAGVPTVLVVDDEPSLRLLCRVNLELDGFRVLEAGTVSAARSLLLSEPIDVLILDVHIAGEDGRDLLDELRATSSPVRIAMLTGSADLRSARFEAADRVLAKPFEPLDLIASVRELAEVAHVDSSA